MFEILDKIAKKMSRIALVFITVLGMVMLFITILAVFCRYILGNSLKWGEELLKIMLVWFGLFSVGVIAYQRQHVGVTIFKEHMPKKVQLVFEKLSQILILVASVAMFIIGLMLVQKSGRQLTPALRLPYAVGYWAIPISYLFMIVYEIRNTVYEFTVNLDGRDADEKKRLEQAEAAKMIVAETEDTPESREE